MNMNMNMNMNLNMDSFVNRLRNTVSQVAYQVNTSVSTIIPGNLIHREYETLKLRCTHGCPGFVWSVYDAVKRDSASLKASIKDAIGPNIMSIPLNNETQLQEYTSRANEKQLYSVFIFDKSQIDCLSNKTSKEAALEHIRRGVTQLTRLRHPAILTVHHPLEESRSSLAFVTEHVYGHLQSILLEQRIKRVEPKKSNTTTNLVDLTQDIGPKDSDYQSDSCQLDDIQIKAGLLHVCDGLKFLHQDAKILHRNLCYDNIFVDSNNTWKISGFDFSSQQLSLKLANNVPLSTNTSLVEFNPKLNSLPQFPSLKTIYSSLPTSVIPNWSCSAPEHSNSDQVTSAADIYSFGIISCALLCQDMDMVDLSYEYGMISDTYKRGIHFREIASKLPPELRNSLMRYAAINVDTRPTLDDFKDIAIFRDQQVQAIRDLDSQFAWDRLKKIDFFNRLREVLPRLSHQVKVNRVAKSLFNEVVNPDMVPYVLPSILIIAKDSTPTEFKLKIFPNLKGPFRVLEPKSVPSMILDSLEVLADRARLCIIEFRQSAFTLIQYLLRTDQQMQEKCFFVLPRVRRFIDEFSLHEQILPELSKLNRETTSPSIRVKCLECLNNMVDIFEKVTVVKYVLPIVFEIPTKESDVISAATKVIKSLANESRAELDKEILATKILPFLIPLSVERDLDLQQYNSLIILIKNLMDRVEREQRTILLKKTQKSQALDLESFKGSSHFRIDS